MNGSADTTMNILQQLNTFLSRDALHHHAIGASSVQYPVYKMEHLSLVCYALNFGVVV
jgi:hypothetical protein